LFHRNEFDVHGISKGVLTTAEGIKFVDEWENGKPWKIDVHESNGQISTNNYNSGIEK